MSAVIWPLALVAGYATAAIVNLALFSYCGREACLTGSVWSTLPAWLAVAVGGWFLRHRGSRTKAALAGAVVAVALGTSNAPLQLQHPLSFSINRFPGDFLIGLVFAPLNAILMLAIAPGSFLYLLPVVGAGALFTALLRSAVPQSWPKQRVRIAAAGILIGAALISEMGATPTVWSLSVHRRIAGFDLQAPPGTMPNAYRLWAHKQLSFAWQITRRLTRRWPFTIRYSRRGEGLIERPTTASGSIQQGPSWPGRIV